jgi:hypothetical protein
VLVDCKATSINESTGDGPKSRKLIECFLYSSTELVLTRLLEITFAFYAYETSSFSLSTVASSLFLWVQNNMTKNADRLQVHTWLPTHRPEIEPEALEKFQKSSHPSTTTKGQSNYSTTFYVSIYNVLPFHVKSFFGCYQMMQHLKFEKTNHWALVALLGICK